MKIIDQIELGGRRTFIRVDFNVPLQDAGPTRAISDDSRIRAAPPTIRLDGGRRVARVPRGPHAPRVGRARLMGVAKDPNNSRGDPRVSIHADAKTTPAMIAASHGLSVV